MSLVNGSLTIDTLRKKARSAADKAGRKIAATHVDPKVPAARAEIAKKKAELSKRLTNWEIEAFDLIARQTMARRLKPEEIEASPEQRAFLSALTQNIILEARAGSGKTTSIVMKVDMLINSLGMNPKHIQILAFNRSAAANLRVELAACLKPEDAACVRVNTFHSLAFGILHASGVPAVKIKFYPEDALSKDHDYDYADDNRRRVMAAAQRIATLQCKDLGQDTFAQRYNDLEQDFWTKRKDFDKICCDAVASAAALFREQGCKANLGSHSIAHAIATTAEQIDANLEAKGDYDGYRGFMRAAELLACPDIHPTGAVASVFGELRFLFVDEAQDYTPAYNEMVKALVKRNPHCTLNAVGDSWQSINGYTGADPEVFNRFDSIFPFTVRLYLTTNLRSAAKVVDLGNAIMMDERGEPSIPRNGAPSGTVLFHTARDPFGKKGDKDQSAANLERLVVRVIDKLWEIDRMNGKEPGEVMLLSERNNLHDREILSFAGAHQNNERVGAMTVFKAKGGGWDHVILLDADRSNFPHAHPADPISRIVTPEANQKAEARRKLYVAVTRAKLTFHALSVSGTQHPALKSIGIRHI